MLFRNERYVCLGNMGGRSYTSDYIGQMCKGLTIFHPFEKPHGWQEANEKVWDACQSWGRPPPYSSVPIPPANESLAHYGNDMRKGFQEHASWQLPTDATVFGSMPSELPELLAARQRLAAATAISSTSSRLGAASPYHLREQALIDQILRQTYTLQQTVTHAAANTHHEAMPGLEPLPYSQLAVPLECVFPQSGVLDRFVSAQDSLVQALKAQGNVQFQQIPTSAQNYAAAALLYSQAAEICCHDNILRAVILSNQAQCFINIDRAAAAAASASAALAFDPTNVKARKRLAAANRKLSEAPKCKPDGQVSSPRSTGSTPKKSGKKGRKKKTDRNASADLSTLNNRLLKATKRGDCNAIGQALDDGADVNGLLGSLGPDYGDASFNALGCAVTKQHVAATQFLLDHKADPNGTTSDGISPLMGMSMIGHEKLMTMLLNAGADPNQQLTTNNPRDAELGFTAFHWACAMGNICGAKVLARNGCNLWLQDERGRTGLDMAASDDGYRNTEEVIEELCELVHSTPVVQSEFDCLICLESFEPMIKLGCACRGSSGRVHEKCLVEYAQHNESSWTNCFTCKQMYTGTTAVRMATTRFELLKDRPTIDPDRLSGIHTLALTLSGGGPDQRAFDQQRAKQLMAAYVDGIWESLSGDDRPWGGPNADWKKSKSFLPDPSMLVALRELAVVHVDVVIDIVCFC